MVTVDDLKQYLRIDGDEEDRTLALVLSTATKYLKGAVANFDALCEDGDFLDLANMAIIIYAKELYSNRDGRLASLPPCAQRIVTMLQTWGDSDVN